MLHETMDFCVATAAMSVFFFGFVFNNSLRVFFHTIVLITGSPLLGEKTYTKLSLIMMLYGFVEELLFPHYRSPIIPALFVYSVALSASFHSSILFDNSAFNRMAVFCGWSINGFHVRNILVHILPSFILYAWMKRDKQGYVNAIESIGPAIGLITSSIHLFWAIYTTGGLNLSEVYIKFEPIVWTYMWIVAVMVHIFIGAYWAILL